MRDEKIADLLDDAEQLWIEVEGVVTHYRRQFTNARRLSAILKWGTIGAAALTALSAIPSASAASEIASTIAQ